MSWEVPPTGGQSICPKCGPTILTPTMPMLDGSAVLICNSCLRVDSEKAWEQHSTRESKSVRWSDGSEITRHGTASGYTKHQSLSERPFHACYEAKKDYDARWRAASETAQKNRLSARAQGRANTRLRAMYPEDYRRIFLEEKARLQEVENEQSEELEG